MLTRDFWKAVFERAAKSAAQHALSVFSCAGVGTLAGLDWQGVLSMAGFGVVYSVLSSIASAGFTGGQASLTLAEVVPDTAVAVAVVDEVHAHRALDEYEPPRRGYSD